MCQDAQFAVDMRVQIGDSSSFMSRISTIWPFDSVVHASPPRGRKSSNDLITASSRPAKGYPPERMKLRSAVCADAVFRASTATAASQAGGQRATTGSTSPRTHQRLHTPTSCILSFSIGRISRTIDSGSATWLVTEQDQQHRQDRQRQRQRDGKPNALARLGTISTEPLSFWMLVLTTSMPTPRPDTPTLAPWSRNQAGRSD